MEIDFGKGAAGYGVLAALAGVCVVGLRVLGWYKLGAVVMIGGAFAALASFLHGIRWVAAVLAERQRAIADAARRGHRFNAWVSPAALSLSVPLCGVVLLAAAQVHSLNLAAALAAVDSPASFVAGLAVLIYFGWASGKEFRGVFPLTVLIGVSLFLLCAVIASGFYSSGDERDWYGIGGGVATYVCGVAVFYCAVLAGAVSARRRLGF